MNSTVEFIFGSLRDNRNSLNKVIAWNKFQCLCDLIGVCWISIAVTGVVVLYRRVVKQNKQIEKLTCEITELKCAKGD